MTMKVTLTDVKRDGSPGSLHGKTVELLMHRYDHELEVDYGLAYIEHESDFSKGYLIFVQKQFADGKWLESSAFYFAKDMPDDDLEHWLTMLRLKA